jgi:hypothetical protein
MRAVAASLAFLLAGAVACVDGKTPDCSDAAAACGPDLGDATIDVQPPVDAPPSDAPSDAPAQDTGTDAADAAG